jgi:hypothetical protein
VGFKDGNQAKEYALNALQICDTLIPYLDEFDAIPKDQRLGSIMVIPEQFYLKCFTEGKKLYVGHVASKRLADGTMSPFHPFDYYHMMADKTDQKMRDMVKDRAKKDIPEIFNAIADSAYAGF